MALFGPSSNRGTKIGGEGRRVAGIWVVCDVTEHLVTGIVLHFQALLPVNRECPICWCPVPAVQGNGNLGAIAAGPDEQPGGDGWAAQEG